MDPTPIGTIGEVAKGVGKIAELVKQRSEQQNTEAMLRNSAAKAKQAILDKATRDVAEWNLAGIRKGAAE